MNRTLLLILGAALVLSSCEQRAGVLDGRVTALSGNDIRVYRRGTGKWRMLDTADFVAFGDTIRVPDGGLLELTLVGGGGTIRFGENVKAQFNDAVDSTGERVIEAYVYHGTVYSDIEQFDYPWTAYRVATPEAVFTAHGTQFTVRYELHARSAEVDVVKGEVWTASVTAGVDTVTVVPEGHFTVVPWHQPPLAPGRIGLARWRRIERVMTPSMPLRRPSVHLVRDIKQPRRMRNVSPGHPRPSVKPRVLKPGPVIQKSASPVKRSAGGKHSAAPKNAAGNKKSGKGKKRK